MIARDADWDFDAPRYSPDGDAHRLHRQPPGPEAHDAGAARGAAERERPRWQVVSADWDHEVHAPLRWDDDGQALLFTAEQQGRAAPVALRPARPRAPRWSSPGGWVRALRQGRRHAGHAGRRRRPSGARARAACRASRRGASSASTTSCSAGFDARPRRRGLVQGRAAATHVQMWLIYPPGFDAKKKYPLLHIIHGGPHTAAGDNWHYRWNNAGVRGAGLRRRLRQLPRLVELRLRVPRQHHAPLGRARTAGRRGRAPTGC